MLLTMHDGRTRLARDVEREVREHFPALVFDTVIPRNVRIGEAPSFAARHPPRPPLRGADAYFELAKEVARVAERALGRGLAALLAISEEAHADAELRHVPLELITRTPASPASASTRPRSGAWPTR